VFIGITDPDTTTPGNKFELWVDPDAASTAFPRTYAEEIAAAAPGGQDFPITYGEEKTLAAAGESVEMPVLRARIDGLWEDVGGGGGSPGPTGPAGPTGATGAASTVPGPVGPTGPAGPQQQKILHIWNDSVIGVPVAWTEYGLGTVNLPWAGRWLITVWGVLGHDGGGGGGMNMCVGVDHANMWNSHNGGSLVGNAQVMLNAVHPLDIAGPGSYSISIFVWVAGGGGSFRAGNATLIYGGAP
jgi:hypothetical protein